MGADPGPASKLFASVSESVAKGLDWGVDTAVQAGSDIKDGAVSAYQAGMQGVINAYQGGKALVASGIDKAADTTKAGIGKATVGLAGSGGSYLTRDAEREAALKRAIDRRADYTAKEVCQECASSRSSAHPNFHDGQFMGDRCALSQGNPKTGRLPAGCGAGCKLPRIYFTNGINNDEAKVCETITAIAEMRCAEVVGIYNATYADSSKVVAPGASPRAATPHESPPWYRPDKLATQALGDKWEDLKHRAADKIGQQGLLMDVLDCLDNIDSAGTEAAAATQSRMLIDSLGSEPPQAVTLYAHSQGGLITQEGLVEARRGLYAKAYQAQIANGASEHQAESAAAAYANQRMGLVNVTSFGTAEAGWPSGPGYQHYTNTRDPVPELIKSVQTNRGIDTSATGGPVHTFTRSPGFDPMDAHGMNETYLPEFAKAATAQRTNGKCCP